MASLRQQIATTALTLTKFRELMRRMQENRPQDDLSIIKKAYDFSLKYHEGQSRASGDPYLVHPLEVALVLADRLHNMRTLEHLPPERQNKIAQETLEIYAPIAHRLGMGKIRGELEDLGFRFIDPVGYEQVEKAVNARRKQGEAFLAKVQQTIKDRLKEAGIQAQ